MGTMKTDIKKDPFPRRPAVNINFNDVTYSVMSWKKLRPERKQILHGVSGEFRSGELTVIMGPSGAGKSTLLNILAGYTVKGSEGSIMVNGELRGKTAGLESFKKISCYIQQEDVIRPLLRVREALIMAIHLKLGCELTMDQKHKKIYELLDMLGLSETINTYCKDLSGGQRKRLSIAMELVTNPPVIFLDEPTTGLDSASTTSCVQLMKTLSEQGRTMVCTIHQPSALLFSQFSQVYCIAEGKSIYQGTPSDLVPFLASFDLVCPPYHNPADFLIEVASGDYPRDIDLLASEADSNGSKLSLVSKKISIEENGNHKHILKNVKNRAESSDSDLGTVKNCLPKPASLWFQLFHLYNRNLIVLKRNFFLVISRLLCHLAVGLMFGYLYQGVGNNAETLLANFIFVYGSNLFLHYTGQMTVLLSFPLEYEVLSREHFNRWYSLAPYCIALFLVEVPFQTVCALAYLCPGYYLTGQPLELDRFTTFVTFNLAICLTAQATGFLAGALLPITIAVFLAPVFSVFFSVFGFTSKYTDIPQPLQPFYNISYFRSAFQGSFLALYGNHRQDLPCYEFYCHYREPEKFLKDMEFTDFRPLPELFYLVLIGIAVYIATLLSVWAKLNRR